MPIPDTIVPKEIETSDQKQARERWKAVARASSKMIRAAMKCKKKDTDCAKCSIVCDEMRAWETVADADAKKK